MLVSVWVFPVGVLELTLWFNSWASRPKVRLPLKFTQELNLLILAKYTETLLTCKL